MVIADIELNKMFFNEYKIFATLPVSSSSNNKVNNILKCEKYKV